MSSIYTFELPTTGSLSFADHFSNGSNVYTTQIANATQARANLHGDKDYLRLVKTLEEYLPQLYSIIACSASGDLIQTQEPIFSWRTTLSAHLFNNSPRLSLPTLPAELVFTLLTYGFALSNLARLNVAALGTYERERGISDVERRAKDEKLGFAVTLLCRASGLFEHISTTVLSAAEQTSSWQNGRSRPPEMTKEVASALSKLASASAQSLAIRKLMTKSSYDSTISPGPPLPSSHPSPALLAKLHLEASALCVSAESLLRIPASRKHDMEVTEPLLLYARDSAALHGALARKWLGADAGARDATGMAVGFLGLAKRELDVLLKDSGTRLGGGGGGKEEVRDWRRERRERITIEAEDAGQFLRYYSRMNDTLSFQPVPSQAELQTAVPAGRLAVAAKAFSPPTPAFGPGSVEYIREHVDSLDLLDEEPSSSLLLSLSGGQRGTTSREDKPCYAGAGSYF
ncbi:hypothetical protein B0F90DRAFT_1768352 [Multifurca ochricompacta]|uniref:pH-response regulator protein palC n=1 Tax=Multifurca ochricompacta TaxID=376703 RepID=A0AAD4LWU8_9AGAM|nr:hypothetical protein B0F90DRAFT_1768352 [Multifurca ochricompacta]